MAETESVKQANNTAEEQAKERTFSQAEVDEIIRKHDGKTFAKFADYDELKTKASRLDEIEEANKSELQKANEKAEALTRELDEIKKANELQAIKQRVSEETGVNASYLNGSTEEECRAIASNFKAFAEANKTPVAPNVKDGGEVKPTTLTKADILAIPSEKERLKAIEQNIELFK